MSYTTFEYLKAEVKNKEVSENRVVGLTVAIKNTGDFDGEEVVQVYGRKISALHFRPIKQLVDFKRIFVKKGQTRKIEFEIPVERLQYWDISKKRYSVEHGTYELQVGSSSVDVKLTTRIKVY